MPLPAQPRSGWIILQKIFIIKFYFMFHEQLFEFFQKGFCFMMLLLIFDIRYQVIFWINRISKCTVFIPPTIKALKKVFPFLCVQWRLILYPLLNRIVQLLSEGELQYAHGPTLHLFDNVTFFIFQNSPNVFEQFFSVLCVKSMFTVFGAEHNLIKYLCICTHSCCVKFYSTLSGCISPLFHCPEFHSGLFIFKPFGLLILVSYWCNKSLVFLCGLVPKRQV